MALLTDPKLDQMVQKLVDSRNKTLLFKAADFQSQGHRHASGIDRVVKAMAKYPGTPKVWFSQATETTTVYFIGHSLEEVFTRLGTIEAREVQPPSETVMIRMMANRMKLFKTTIEITKNARLQVTWGRADAKTLQKVLGRDLDSLAHFRQAIRDVEKIMDWAPDIRQVKQFLEDKHYAWTSEIIAKAWNFANNNPVEGLR
jgi:hypothetical protein